MLTLTNVKIFIQKLDHTVDRYVLPLIVVPDKPDFDFMRKTLCESPLGASERDIFFPSWTKTILVLHLDDTPGDFIPTNQYIVAHQVEIKDDKTLAEVLHKEADKPGSVSIILQECRSKRYTRKPVADDQSHPPSPSVRHGNPPVSPQKQKAPPYAYAPPYVQVYPQEGCLPVETMYYDPMHAPYGVVQPPMYPQPMGFLHYGCVPYGYVPGFVPPYVHPQAYYGYNGI